MKVSAERGRRAGIERGVRLGVNGSTGDEAGVQR